MTALSDRIEGLLHEPTQVHDDRIDLSLADVKVVREPGRVDFGGGELADAELDPLETALRNPGDDYGWYELREESYVVEFNESLTGDDPVLLQPRRELLERGGSLPTLRTSDLGPVPLSVPHRVGRGDALRLKENARVASVLDR
ncbi:deoxycytidine triphosphate deaminase [Candidatus Halobonum tyrrellensis]|uniref:Deoxycytidine triphosphate deaminase n=1 Tax=Candidatus Halobonum tyrrellensis G22 TaxID=1324957 RepID=V4HG57_9EURY|nr:deoxycytidine triphosphate deaminase [Candidatus Halobonum tyrrellensis]ESP89103.1 deoxycytidine triphosphate deaminase [Candidatus Halobonum tyrrellensis G22]